MSRCKAEVVRWTINHHHSSEIKLMWHYILLLAKLVGAHVAIGKSCQKQLTQLVYSLETVRESALCR